MFRKSHRSRFVKGASVFLSLALMAYNLSFAVPEDNIGAPDISGVGGVVCTRLGAALGIQRSSAKTVAPREKIVTNGMTINQPISGKAADSSRATAPRKKAPVSETFACPVSVIFLPIRLAKPAAPRLANARAMTTRLHPNN